MSLAAGIVLYNPNLETLKNSIIELIDSVQLILLIDNGSSNINDIKKMIASFDKIELVENDQNLGIAKALNQILELSYKNEMNYVLTLDQDSILKETMLVHLLEYQDIPDVAIFCPEINDLNKNIKGYSGKEYQVITRCITSGSLMNLKVCKEIGYFDDKMFIDYVDFDYCKRVNLAGKKIVCISKSIIDHEIGKRTQRKFLFWTVYPTNHNPSRVYYYSRNISYYLRKFRRELTVQEKLIEYKYLLWKFVSILFYEQDKLLKIRMFMRGIGDRKRV